MKDGAVDFHCQTFGLDEAICARIPVIPRLILESLGQHFFVFLQSTILFLYFFISNDLNAMAAVGGLVKYPVNKSMTHENEE